MLRDKIRGLRKQTVTVLGEEVEVRGLSAKALVALEDAVPSEDGKRDRVALLVRYVVACTFNPDGSPTFTEEDVGWLATDADGGALKDLFAVAAELNGLGGGEKNSAPASASPSGSP